MSKQHSFETIRNLLQNTRCISLLRGQAVIEIDAEDSIAKGCQVLVSNGISSAPVYDKVSEKYVGMLDYRDIVDYVLAVFHKKRLQPISEDEVIGINEIVHRATAGETISAKAIAGKSVLMVVKLLDLSRKNPFYSVMTHSSLEAAVEIFSRNLGIHRVNVVNDQGMVEGLLSKTDVVRFLLSHIEVFGEKENKTIKEAGLGKCPVVTISCTMHCYLMLTLTRLANSTVLDALERMSEYGVSSIPVIDSDNHLMGNISMADVRHNRFNRIWLSCANFVSLALSQKGLENAGQDRFPVFEVTNSTAIGKVMEKLLATRTHRIWVVDEIGQLEGVMSMTDIIRFLCKLENN